MPRVQLFDAHMGELLKNLGWFETANQARTSCSQDAEDFLVWALSPDGLWVAEEEDAVYQIETDPPEDSTTA